MTVLCDAVSVVGPPAMSSGQGQVWHFMCIIQTIHCVSQNCQQAKASPQISLHSQETTCTQEQTSVYSNYLLCYLGACPIKTNIPFNFGKTDIDGLLCQTLTREIDYFLLISYTDQNKNLLEKKSS